MARLGSGIPLVARVRELTGLRTALQDAVLGRPGAVLVSGEAGVGKSRLVDELARSAGDALVLGGRCLDVAETGVPYPPFTEVARRVRAEGLLDLDARPALRWLLPELSPVPDRGAVDPHGVRLPGRRGEQDTGQLRLFDAVLALLTDLAARGPVLLVLEDLHLADASTRALLVFLLSRLRDQRLLVVTTHRSDDLRRDHPLRPVLAELGRLPSVRRLDLAPLSAIDTRGLVAALDAGLSDELVLRVAERAEGNPFLAEELAADPHTLGEPSLARASLLGPGAARVARVVAVAGRPLRAVDLAAFTDDVELGGALREAVRHGVLVERDGAYRFRHALAREAVLADLLPGERVRLHAAFAELLGTTTGRGVAASVAHHALAAGNPALALASSVRAAAEAAACGAPAEALRHREVALRLWTTAGRTPSGITEADLLRQASWAAGASGLPERAVALARAGVELVDGTGPEAGAALWLRLARALAELDDADGEREAAVEQAWLLLRDRPACAERAEVLAGWAAALHEGGKRAEAAERAEQAVADGRASGAWAAVADALTTLAVLDAEDGRGESALRRHLEAVEHARGGGAVGAELRARRALGRFHHDTGQPGRAVEAFDAGVRRADETGVAWSALGVELRAWQVLTRYRAGDWAGAAGAAGEAGAWGSERLAAARAQLLVGRGEFEAAERELTGLRWSRDAWTAEVAGAADVELLLWRGQPDSAVDRAVEATGVCACPAGVLRLLALGVAAWAELAGRARRRRDRDAEERAVAEGRALAGRARAVRGGGADAAAWLARVDAEEDRLVGGVVTGPWLVAAELYGDAHEQAVCRWRAAETALARGQREQAATLLKAADTAAELLGARPLRDAVRQTARRGRVVLRGEVPGGQVDPFTPRERSVLALVALGRTNREVGEELVISEKTVSVHLTRIMAKLGAGRRGEAVAIAFERGLLDVTG
ncbi:helix-turn-helix transcriptional regulator [Actinosynnema mirum]|uniref:Transcriptional regulator, LuxR family n=1 Tax=Actinosynnema mirum (strain ATCC 29888 / DSM 43827 / JCM 3225 / NBRC 14064 / NCIMB 13271 / NRRL B-12336 / IMRU 3971 / 101) TaxID=446462 RepID=C6WCA3_ACTMD|nr:LuxR family transcriptional regulator [Actinosynnema mirum]ACU39491.1 transcriptional regulator, LuxR family [Actinosynnema mirum DSM 43827]